MFPLTYPRTLGGNMDDKLEVFTPHDGTQDLAWLQANYAPGLRVLRSQQTAAFRLRKINIVTSGVTNLTIWVFDKNGKPAIGQPTTYTYYRLDGTNPSLPAITGTVDLWAPRGVLNKNRVDGTGKIDYQVGSDSWIKNGVGPYAAFVLSPSIGSDCIDGIGWLGGTNHEGPMELFFFEEDDTPPPPPDDGDQTDVLAAIAALDVKVSMLMKHFTTI